MSSRPSPPTITSLPSPAFVPLLSIDSMFSSNITVLLGFAALNSAMPACQAANAASLLSMLSPRNMSEPSPPMITSSPSPPMITSSPPPPKIMSSPPRPSIKSASLVPKTRSMPSVVPGAPKIGSPAVSSGDTFTTFTSTSPAKLK